MNVVSLITRLAARDVRLWQENGNLRYSAPDGAMTQEMINELRTAKADIIAFLQQSESARSIQLPAADRSKPLPASYAQQRLWFIHQLDPANTAYHIHVALRIHGKLDAGLLGQACSEIVRRHEILRTRYVQQGGMVQQVIESPFAVTITTESLAAGELPRALHNELHTPFNLQGRIFRIRLWQMADKDFALSFTIHHIAADGWSLGIFVNELVQLYESLRRGQPAPLPELPRQYADYVIWQQQDSARHEQQLDYWKQQLAAAPNLNLPYDAAPGAGSGNEGGFVASRLEAPVLEKLQQLNKAEGTTLFMSLLATLAVVLHRYSQQQDFCIGTPVAGRSVSQLEPMIGCFLNVLALRCQPQPGQSFRAFLHAVKNTCSAAFANQDVAFEHIVQEVAQERDLAITPLFQVLLSLQNAPVTAISLPGGLDIAPIEDTEADAQLDLSVTVREEDGKLQLRLVYKKSRFHPSTIERLCTHWVRLLESAAGNPDQRLADLPLLSPAELRLQEERHKATLRQTGFEAVHERIGHCARTTPDATALVFAGAVLTYRQLDEKANALANTLLEQGITPESLVAIYQRRSLEMVISILAILKAGAAYVPIDPDQPTSRTAEILDACQPAAVVAGTSSVEDLPDTLRPIRFTHHDLDQGNIQAPPGITRPEQLAYVIFTSGSTGKPKGVMIEHASLCNHMLWMLDEFGFTRQDRFLQKTPFVFDASVWEFFAPLMSGATLVIAEPGQHRDPASLRDLTHQQQITVLQFVPSLLKAFLDSRDTLSCPSLRQVFCGGEPLSTELAHDFYSRFPGASLVNLYGPTETTIDSSFSRCQPDDMRITIGKPIWNVAYHILDAGLNYLPDGLPGELYIGGACLARGYLNRDDLTKSSFIPGPEPATPHNRLYKTGDLVRYLPDGNYEFLGRVDHQVKIRGLRIEPGEIENRLQALPDIRECVVIAINKDNNPDNQHLVAYCIPAAEELDMPRLRHELLQQLPQYMVPSFFIPVASWPLSANGKIDRKALPAPDWTQLGRREYVAPTTGTEATLAAIWAEVLGVEQVGIHDSFFELGGHSLTATQAIARAQEAFAVEVPLREIFENPTIAAIAGLVDKALLEQAVFSNTTATDDDSESFIL